MPIKMSRSVDQTESGNYQIIRYDLPTGQWHKLTRRASFSSTNSEEEIHFQVCDLIRFNARMMMIMVRLKKSFYYRLAFRFGSYDALRKTFVFSGPPEKKAAVKCLNSQTEMSWKLIFNSLHKSEHNLNVFSVGERSDIVPRWLKWLREIFFGWKWLAQIFVCFFGENWAEACDIMQSPAIGVNVMRATRVFVLF